MFVSSSVKFGVLIEGVKKQEGEALKCLSLKRMENSCSKSAFIWLLISISLIGKTQDEESMQPKRTRGRKRKQDNEDKDSNDNTAEEEQFLDSDAGNYEPHQAYL